MSRLSDLDRALRAAIMIGLWHDCGCGCGFAHKVIDDRVICPHPADQLDENGRVFVSDPERMCPPCVAELEDALAASERAALEARQPTRKQLAEWQGDIVAEMTAGVEAIEQSLSAEQGTDDTEREP